MWGKARGHCFPGSGHRIEGNNNQEQLVPGRVVKSHLSLPSILFLWNSITTVCGATTASARRRESQALPHTNHPLGQLFWQFCTKGTAWAGHQSSALARVSWGGEHAQAVGEESSPTCSPAEPPWLSDAIYPADICLPLSAGTLSPCAGLPWGAALLVAALISSMELFCFPVEQARSPRAVFGGEGSLLSWGQGR